MFRIFKTVAVFSSVTFISSALWAAANGPMSIRLKPETSVVLEKKIVNVLAEEQIVQKDLAGKDFVTVTYTSAFESSVHTSANSFEADFFTEGIQYPSIGFETALSANWSYKFLAGWTDQEQVAYSELLGTTRVRAHLIPLTAGIHYSIPNTTQLFLPKVGLSVVDFILLQRSETQDAETSENNLYALPHVGLDVRLSKEVRLMGQIGYFLKLDANENQIQNVSAHLGLGIEI